MEERITSKPAFTVVGLKYHGKNENEEIPQLWQKMGPRFSEITDVLDEEVCYGVCHNLDEGTGEFDYLAVLEVSGDGEVPDGMVRWEIPEQTYAVFECTLPTIGQTFDYIHKTWFPQSNYKRAPGPELERYDEDFDPNNPSSVMQVWIPVEPW